MVKYREKWPQGTTIERFMARKKIFLIVIIFPTFVEITSCKKVTNNIVYFTMRDFRFISFGL